MFYKIALIGFAFLTGCAVTQETPVKAALPREEMTMRPGFILERELYLEAEYDQARQEELKRKGLGDEAARSSEKFYEWATVAPVPLIVPIIFAFAQSDSTQEMAHPQRYKFTVKLNSGEVIQVVDTYPFEAHECIRVGTGVVTGKMTLLSGNKDECKSS